MPGRLQPRSLAFGLLGMAAIATFYVTVVWAASGSFAHLVDQMRTDWYLVAAVTVGFAVQVALLVELRARHRAHMASTAATGAAAGASAAGMVACCAHHLADLLPFVGLTGAATFLYDQRLWFVFVGVAVNAAAITLAARRLRHVPPVGRTEEVRSCLAA